jgi:hypothetical protein
MLAGMGLLLLSCAGPSASDRPEARGEIQDGWSAVESGLRLRVHSPNQAYRDPGAFVLTVEFENLGQTPLVIFPTGIYRQYRPLDSTMVTYEPYPGPRISPWKDLFAIGPQERRAVQFIGMRDGDGIWQLDAGSHALSVHYFVGADLASNVAVQAALPRAVGEAARVWVGELQSPEIIVRFDPRSAQAKDRPTPSPDTDPPPR